MTPKRFPDAVPLATVRTEAEKLEAGGEAETVVKAAGRILGRRELGKLVFLDLVDRSARIQLLCDTARTGSVDVDLGDLLGVSGAPAKARRGEPSIAVHELVLLGKIHSPLPDTFHGITDTEVRYRKRYLDLLMSDESRRDAVIRSRMIAAIRAYLDGEGFLEVETPILQPRYGGAFAEPFVTHSKYLDQDVYLRIADELYLKRLIVGGLEKVYEIGKDFRNEGVSYKHSPEFTQLEWYEAYADYRDTMERTETLGARAAEQAERFAMQAAERAAGAVTVEEGDPDFVEAMSYGMPPTGGCGVGMDRLAMLLTGRDTIRDVILFPALRQQDS